MSEKYPYSRTAAIKCAVVGHDWMAYDLTTDKCLRCNKERGHFDKNHEETLRIIREWNSD